MTTKRDDCCTPASPEPEATGKDAAGGQAERIEAIQKVVAARADAARRHARRGRVWAGGTPHFDERTGRYRRRPHTT